MDIRDKLFCNIIDKRFCAAIIAERSGVLANTAEAYARAAEIGVKLEICRRDGDELSHGQCFAHFAGTPTQIAVAEEQLVGSLAKASGIATAAKTAVQLAGGRVRIVSGSWKKMPPLLKSTVRNAVMTGGASFRICDQPMLYIDKNYIRMLGSIPKALAAASPFPEAAKVIQLKGLFCPIAVEARLAAEGGASILMVDTGRIEDLSACLSELERMGVRQRHKVAFAGNIALTDIPELTAYGADILCVGREIVDARLLDMRLDIVGEESLWVK